MARTKADRLTILVGMSQRIQGIAEQYLEGHVDRHTASMMMLDTCHIAYFQLDEEVTDTVTSRWNVRIERVLAEVDGNLPTINDSIH